SSEKPSGREELTMKLSRQEYGEVPTRSFLCCLRRATITESARLQREVDDVTDGVSVCCEYRTNVASSSSIAGPSLGLRDGIRKWPGLGQRHRDAEISRCVLRRHAPNQSGFFREHQHKRIVGHGALGFSDQVRRVFRRS